MANAAPSQPYDSPAYSGVRKVREIANENRPPSGTDRTVRAFPATQTRNPRVVRSSASPGQPTVSDTFTATYDRAGISGDFTKNARLETTDRAAQQKTTTKVPRRSIVRRSHIPRVRRKTGKKSVGTKMTAWAWAKARVSAANAILIPWNIFWYLSVQLPFALISVAGIGMAAYIYSVVENLKETVVGSIITYAFGNIKFNDIGSGPIASAASYLLGISFDPYLLFIIPFVVVFCLGLLQILLSWFIYSMFRIKSLSGSGGNTKIIMFVLALVGIIIPILNLFPLILFWNMLVWAKPK